MPHLRIDNLGSIGLVSDLSPMDIPPQACTSLTHTLAEDGVLRSGMYEIPTTSLACAPRYHTTHPDLGGTPWLFYSDGQRLFSQLLDGEPIDITPNGWGTSGRVTFAALNTVLFVNHVRHGLFRWTGVEGARAIPSEGWPTAWRADSIAALRYSLVALGMTEGPDYFPTKIRWSSEAPDGDVPSQWEPALTNTAGDDILGESPGAITGAARAGERLWIVKTDGMYEMTWVGGPTVFQTRRLSDQGTRLDQGFCAVRDRLAMLTSNDVLLWDGSQWSSLIDRRVRRRMQQLLDFASWDQAVLYYHKALERLYVGIPKASTVSDRGPLQNALIWHAAENTWSHRELQYGWGFSEAQASIDFSSATWDEQTATWDDSVRAWDAEVYNPTFAELLIFGQDGTSSVSILTDEPAVGAAETVITPRSSAGRVGLAIDGASNRVLLTDAWLELSGGGEVTIEFGGHDTANTTPNRWSKHVVRADGQQHVDPRVSGRYLAWRLTADGTQPWRLGSITLQYQSEGTR